jgi:hypothetical protein
MPVCVALMPLAKHVIFLGLVMIVLGFNMGCIDNIANLAILKLHSNNVSPFIQVICGFFINFNPKLKLYFIIDDAFLLRHRRISYADRSQILS